MGKEDIEEGDENELQNQRIQDGFIISLILKLFPLLFYKRDQKTSNVSSKFINKQNLCKFYNISLVIVRLLFDGINSKKEMLIE